MSGETCEEQVSLLCCVNIQHEWQCARGLVIAAKIDYFKCLEMKLTNVSISF